MPGIESVSTNPLTGNIMFHSAKPLDLTNFTKNDVKEYFRNSYDLYETLFTGIKYDAAYYLCPDRLRLPLIFYYGHSAAVFMNKLCLSGLIKPSERVNFEFESMFETGVDEMSWDDIEHFRMGGDYKWPTVQETKDYRAKVRDLINKVIDRTPLELPVNWDSPWWALFMGFEHERIHYETSSVLIRQYPINMVTKPDCWKYAPFNLKTNTLEPLSNPMIKVPDTNVRIGKSYDFPSYGWDNEYGQVDCKIGAFEASKYKITNEQFLEFILNDGYNKREYWSDEGWEWVQFKQAKHPLFWVCPMNCKSGCGGAISAHSHCQEEEFTKEEIDYFMKCTSEKQTEKNNNPFKFRLMFNIVSMPKNWPVEVNYHESKAYCKWKGNDYRVISEAEHHAIRDEEVFDLNVSSDIIYQNQKVNHNMLYGSSNAVNMFPENSKGFNDVFGNVWEWCEDNFNGLPGGKTHYLYDDFSSPCYDGRHNVIMGGSWASTGDEASRFARYMFRRHFYQHCGFRLVRSLPTIDGSKPNPQIRLVVDRIYVLGSTTPENKCNLDENKLEIGYYKTTNDQYLYDSHLHPEYLDNQIIDEYDNHRSLWINEFINKIYSLVSQYVQNLDTAVILGSSLGRTCFRLADHFQEVIGVDFCGKFLNVASKIQNNHGKLSVRLQTFENRVMNINVEIDKNINKVVFKQMTWIPNEIPKSELVLFTMIDRVTFPLSWLKRFREVVKRDGLLVIYSKESKWTSSNLGPILEKDFDLVYDNFVTSSDSFTAWKIKKNIDL